MTRHGLPPSAKIVREEVRVLLPLFDCFYLTLTICIHKFPTFPTSWGISGNFRIFPEIFPEMSEGLETLTSYNVAGLVPQIGSLRHTMTPGPGLAAVSIARSLCRAPAPRAACSCSDARAVAALTIANEPADGAEATADYEETRPPPLDEDGVFHGPGGSEATESLGEFLLRHIRVHADAQRVAQVAADTHRHRDFTCKVLCPEPQDSAAKTKIECDEFELKFARENAIKRRPKFK